MGMSLDGLASGLDTTALISQLRFASTANEAMPAEAWNRLSWPKMSANCLGKLLRDSGQSRVPEPPHRITGCIMWSGGQTRAARRRSPNRIG